MKTRLIFTLSLGVAALNAYALGPAVTSFTGGSRFTSFFGSQQSTPDVVGFRFTANTDFNVVRLGVWNDNDLNGLEEDHEVGLWRQSDGVLLAQATVGPTGILIGDFRYTAISAVTLNSGTDYIIGATYWTGGLDGYISSPTSATYDADITHVGAMHPAGVDMGFVMPVNLTTTNRGRFGPNFISEAVPEPSSMALLALGGLALLRRRRKA